jgi:hypothetical protein
MSLAAGSKLGPCEVVGRLGVGISATIREPHAEVPILKSVVTCLVSPLSERSG